MQAIPTQHNRFSFIDALRGLASMAVVLFHAVAGEHINSLPPWLRATVAQGEFGVSVFFVLSGFVIAHSQRDRKLTICGVGHFMLRRSIRLDPPYWVAIATAIGFALLASTLVKNRAPIEFSAPQIISHLFYLQDLVGYKNVNPAFWTLCYEIQFYLVFALLLCAHSRKWIAAAFILSLLWPLGLAPTIRGLFVNLWFGFLLGVGAYYAWRTPKILRWFLAYAAVIGVAAVWRDNHFALVCVATAVVITLMARAGRIGSLNWRWLQFLGAISYSLYLIHHPIIAATFRVWFMLFHRSPLTEFTGWVASIVACIVAAYLLWRLVERPSIWLARRTVSNT
jgi:peptidoglycan/LPS O-acetylase OafA/YrhL